MTRRTWIMLGLGIIVLLTAAYFGVERRASKQLAAEAAFRETIAAERGAWLVELIPIAATSSVATLRLEIVIDDPPAPSGLGAWPWIGPERRSYASLGTSARIMISLPSTSAWRTATHMPAAVRDAAPSATTVTIAGRVHCAHGAAISSTPRLGFHWDAPTARAQHSPSRVAGWTFGERDGIIHQLVLSQQSIATEPVMILRRRRE